MHPCYAIQYAIMTLTLVLVGYTILSSVVNQTNVEFKQNITISVPIDVSVPGNSNDIVPMASNAIKPISNTILIHDWDEVKLSKPLREILELSREAYYGKNAPEIEIKSILSRSDYDSTHACFRVQDASVLIAVLQDLETLVTNIEAYPFLEEQVIKLLDMHADIVDSKISWTNNWYESSITYPRIFIKYIVLSYRIVPSNKVWLDRVTRYCKIIQKINPEPDRSSFIKHKRNGSNLVQMAYFYYFSKMVLDEYNISYVTNQKFVEAYENYFPKVIPTALIKNYDGIYSDNTYIFHKDVRAYGYLSELTGYEWFYTAVFFATKEPVTYLAIRDVMHPNIDRIHHSITNRFGKFTKLPPYHGELHSLPHVKWFDIGKLVSCLYEDYVLQYLGAEPNLAAFEYDQHHQIFFSSWLWARRIHTNDTIEKIQPEYDQYEPGTLVFNGKIPKFKTVPTTSSVHLDKSSWSIAKQHKSILVVCSYIKYENNEAIDYTISMPEGLIRIFGIANNYRRIQLTIGHGQPNYAHDAFDNIVSEFINIENIAYSSVRIPTYPGHLATVIDFEPEREMTFVGYSNIFKGKNIGVGVSVMANVLTVKFLSEGREYTVIDVWQKIKKQESHSMQIRL